MGIETDGCWELYSSLAQGKGQRVAQIFPHRDQSDTSRLLGRTVETATVVAGGTGVAFLEPQNDDLDLLWGSFAHGTCGTRRELLPILDTVLNRFVCTAPDRPVLAYYHSTTWSVAAISEFMFGGSIRAKRKRPIRLSRSGDFLMSFPGHDFPKIRIPSLEPHWLLPPGGENAKDLQLKRTRSTLHHSKDGTPLGSTFREMVCVEEFDEATRAFGRTGLPPAALDRTFLPIRAGDGPAVELQRLEIGASLGDAHSNRVAVLDFELFKLIRLDLVPRGHSEVVTSEELVIAMDPRSSKVLYVASSCGVFEPQLRLDGSIYTTHFAGFLK